MLRYLVEHLAYHVVALIFHEALNSVGLTDAIFICYNLELSPLIDIKIKYN